MTIAQIIETNKGQAVQLPAGFRFESATVSIRRAGDSVILEPIKAATWPDGFFAAIAIEDPAFARPAQGTMPPVTALDQPSK